jgi:uncharacterized protein YmfQ (DUF2313 family)
MACPLTQSIAGGAATITPANCQTLIAGLFPQYCSLIVDRWEKLTGQTAEKVGNI